MDLRMRQLAQALNYAFGEPFMPEGFFKAKMLKDGSLEIRMGDRDVTFDKNLILTGSGMKVGAGAEWFVNGIPPTEK